MDGIGRASVSKSARDILICDDQTQRGEATVASALTSVRSNTTSTTPKYCNIYIQAAVALTKTVAKMSKTFNIKTTLIETTENVF